MALNPVTEYPGQITGISIPYPRGSGQDVTVPGDGTGTPWDKRVLDDIWGLFQGLLGRAGINPSGDADTAVVSQYIEALSRICGRASTTTAAIFAADYTNAENIETSGHTTSGDGGHAVWRGTGVVDVPSLGTADYPNGFIYDNEGNQFAIVGNVINPRMYGAKGDGTPGDDVFINAAIQTLASGVVYFDGGTYACSAEILLKDGVSLRGESRDTATLDFTGALAASFPNNYCLYGAGTVDAALPALSVDVGQGDVAFTFAAAHGLAVDDVFIILDPTNSSLSAAQLYYRAGEMVRVATEDGAAAATGGRATFAAYLAATVNTAKLNPIRTGIEDLEIIGIGSTEVVGLYGVTFGRDVFARRLRCSGSQAEASLSVGRSYGVTVDDVVGWEFANFAPNRRSIVAVWNSQRVAVSGLRGSSSQAFLQVGGIDATWAVPCRDVLVSDCHVDDSVFADLSVNINGCTEFWRIVSSTLAGVRMGGDKGAISACTLYGTGPGGGAADLGRAIRLSEAHGADFSFTGVTFLATRNVGSSVALVHLDDTTGALDTDGVMTFNSCRFDMLGFVGDALLAVTRSTTASASVEMADCVCRGGEGIRFEQGTANTAWQHIGVRGLDSVNSGVYIEAAEDVDIAACRIRDAVADGINISDAATLPFATIRARVQATTVFAAQDAGIRVSGTGGGAVVLAMIQGGLSTNNNQSAGAIDNASVRFDSVFLASMHDTVIGDDDATPTQLASYSANAVTSLVVVNCLTVGATLSRSVASITTDHSWGDRVVGTDEQRASGKLMLAGATLADAGAGASDLVMGDGVGNVGYTTRAAVGGVGRWVSGDSGDADRFRCEFDHSATAANRVWDFYADGGRDLRLRSDAVELGRVYGDGAQPVDSGDFSSPSWLGSPSFTYGGSECAAFFEVVNGSAAASGQMDYTFPAGAYDWEPLVFVELVGTGTRELIKLSGVTTTVATVILANGGLPAGTTRVNIWVIGSRTDAAA